MCRLFGFRSVINSQVHKSLLSADNALIQQSQAHPDGWGVAYYVAGAPHVIKSAATAVNDSLFQRVSGVVSSQTVLAHIRLATLGEIDTLNTHPFQFGRWVFAHNGNIKEFENYREVLKDEVAPSLRRFILGNTDSEILFYLLLTELQRDDDLTHVGREINDVADAIRRTIARVTQIVGPFHPEDAAPTETYLSFILTNGEMMLAHQGGKRIFYSTYKKRCSERDTCPSFSPVCESPRESGKVNHMIFSSEPLSGENIWEKMSPGEILGVDWKMNLVRFSPEG